MKGPVLLLALAVPGFGPLIAWMLPSKRIDEQGSGRGEEIQRLYREDPGALVDYNLEDARLVLDLLRDEGLIGGVGLTNFDSQHLRMITKHGIDIVSNQVCFLFPLPKSRFPVSMTIPRFIKSRMM